MHTKRFLTLLLVLSMILSCVLPAAAAADRVITSVSEPVGETAASVPGNTGRSVATGSESVRGEIDVDASELKAPASANVATTQSGSGWLAEIVDKEIDLTAANDCVSELELLADEYAPNEYVSAFVVLEEAPLADTYSSKRKVPASILNDYEAKQNALIDTMQETLGDDVKVVCSFNYLTNAVVVETEFANLTALAKLDGVASVFVSPTFYPANSDAEQMTVSAGQMTNVDDVWNLNGTGYTGAGMTIAVLDTGLDLDHPSFADDPELTEDSWTIASLQAKLDELSGENGLNAIKRYSGTLTAEALYYNAKVPFCFNYNLGTTNVTHNDTLGDHGTHVSGIAAANEVEGTGVVGMAPDAQLIAMKVFNASTGGASLQDFVAALEDCILLEVDVANLSLGSAAGFSDSSYAEIDAIYQRIKGTGLIVNIAAGNEGTSSEGSLYGEGKALTSTIDNSTVASPSTYANVMSIASVDNDFVMANYFTFGENGTKVFYQSCMEYLYGYITNGIQEVFGGQTLDYTIVDGLGNVEDFYDADGNSLVEGKVAVIRRGSLNFSVKIANAEAAGAVGAIIWNNVSEDIYSFGLSVENTEENTYPGIPVVLVSLEDGQKMADCESKTMTVVKDPALRVNTTGGQISSFSSWGVSSDLRLLPDLAGIGGNVYSCYDGGKYGLMSGTSMATPQVSGVSAIVKQYLKTKGMTSNEATENLLLSTAKPVVDADSGLATSPRQQGAGLVDALSAVTSEAYLTVDGGRPKAELGSSAEGIYTFTFEIHNFGTETKTYALSADLLCEDYVESANYDGVTYMAGYDTTLDGTVKFDADTVTVAPGSIASVSVTVTLSESGKKWIEDHFENGNYVEGYVYLTDTAEEGGVDLSLPYLGFYRDWSDAPIFDSGFWYDNSFWAGSVEGVNNTFSAEEYWTIPWVNMGSSNNDWILGMNPYSGALPDENGNVIYSSDNNVLSPNGDGIMDKITDYYLALLRNAKYIWLTYTDAEGNLLHRQTMVYESKTMYNANYGATVPSVYSWYYNTDNLYDFTDANGNYLPDGTTVTLTVSAVLDYMDDQKVEIDEDGNVTPVNPDDSFSVPITIDVTAPAIATDEIVETLDEDGNRYLTFTVCDAHPATAALLNPSGTQIYDQVYDNSMTDNGDGTYTVSLDITGCGDDFLLAVGDYAYNETYYSVSRAEQGGNDPVMDTDALYAYQVYNASIYYYYGWDSMFGWTIIDTESGEIEMINSDANEDYALNAAEYVDGYVFAVDAGGNFLRMTPGLWNRNMIRTLDYNVIDMAFDDTTGTMYIAISDNESYTYGLGTLDLLTGEVTILRNYYDKYSMPWAMTFVDGKLYCCKYYYSGFYYVDFESNYTITPVTDSDGNEFKPTTSGGYNTNPYYGQSMTYSRKDGKIYWCYCSSESTSELIAIDPVALTCESISLGGTEFVGVLTLEETAYKLPASEQVTSLAMSSEELVTAVGKTTELKAYALPWNAPAAEITWRSDDESVATVEDGTVKAVGEGETFIVASCGEAIATCYITVIDTSGTLYAYDYSADGTYGYWQTIDTATMNAVNGIYSEAQFMAADYNGHDGYIYGYDSTDSNQSWRMDPETGKTVKLKGTGYVVDMAYDYSTGIMYAIMYNSTKLYAMNMHTGKLVEVADTGHYLSYGTLACDLEGNLYAIDVAGTLWGMSLYETTAGEDGGDDGGIGGWEPLCRALNDPYDVMIDDDFGITEEEESDTVLAVEMNYITDLDVSVYDTLYYGQSMCYDYNNDVLLWCYTDGLTFRWIDLDSGLVYDLGTAGGHAMPQYFGLHTIPAEIPELEDVYLENLAAEDLFLLVGGSAEPVVNMEPVNVNVDYTLEYEVVSNLADDGSDDVVAEIVDGEISALKAGTAYVDVCALDQNGEVQGYTCIRVTVKNATTSDIRMYMGDTDNWVSVDQRDTGNLTPYGNAIYDGTAYFMYSAEYVDSTGYIYGYGFDQTQWDTDFKFLVFDAESMNVVSVADMGNGFPFVYDLEFDYTTGTMYALAGTSDVVALYYVDLQTGKLVKACSLDGMYLNMTVDAEGTVYLMTRSESSFIYETEEMPAELYTVDVKTGECTFVLNTGVYSPYISSLGYDYDTGYLYWTPYEGLYLIDVADCTVNRVGDLVGQNEALLLLANEYPEVPAHLTDAVLTNAMVELSVGESAAAELFVKPSTIVADTTWYSDNESVATVDENGVITAVAPGTATVIAVVTDGDTYVLASCMVLVYGENDYFISYNVTDRGFSAIDRLDPTKVTNLTEGESEPAVTAMAEFGGAIYAYDEENQLFKTDAESGFKRTCLGDCGIDTSAFDIEGVDNEYQKEVYTTTFTIADMTVYDGRLLALGVVGYDVYSVYYYGGEVVYEDNYRMEMYGGCALYEVDTETGKLTQLCVIQAEDGDYMNGAKMIAVDGAGRFFVYSTYNDHICLLNPEDGASTFFATLQSLSVYGDEASNMAMYYDAATNNMYMILTTNGNYYRLFKLNVDTGSLYEVSNVGEVVYDDDAWSYNGDCFGGLLLHSAIVLPEHTHSYLEFTHEPTCTENGAHGFACECGVVLFEETIPAKGHTYVDGVCTDCGAINPDATEPFVNPFSDVSESAWYYDYVMAAAEAGLVNGYEDGTFQPEGNLTRAEAVALLYRVAGSPEVEGKASFTDLPYEWYQDAIAWAEQNEIVNGVGNGEFEPNEFVTREQFVTMIWRLEGRPAAEAGLTGFEDIDSINDWALEAFQWAVAKGIINGTTFTGMTGTYLAPQDNITRAEAAKILVV